MFLKWKYVVIPSVKVTLVGPYVTCDYGTRGRFRHVFEMVTGPGNGEGRMTNQIQPSNSSSTINPNDDEVCRLDQGDVSNDRTRYTELAKKKKKLESQLAERMAIEMNNQSSPLLAFNLQNQLSAFMGHDQMDDVPGGGEFVTLSDLKSVIAAFVKTDGNGSSQQEDAMPAQLNQASRRVHATSSPSPGTGAMDALPGRSSSSSSPSPSSGSGSDESSSLTA